jgi:folate-binding protein YgfZ
MTTSPDTSRATALPFLGVLSIGGPDALDFLQGQFTNDVRLLADGRTQLAALCTPQGRVLALPRLRLVDGIVYALLPMDLLESMHMLLRRFVLRSRVRLQVVTDLQVRWNAAGDESTAIDTCPIAASSVSTAPCAVAFDYAPGRSVHAAPADKTESVAGAPVTINSEVQRQWLTLDISDGLPQVFAATSGSFVPHMLNLDLLDAISFTKGCYTGQEIVARTQHLGRIKRRLLGYRLPSGTPPAPLAGLYRDGTKAAEVLMSAGVDGAVNLLAVTSLDARGSPLCVEDGRTAEPVELPYRVPVHD